MYTSIKQSPFRTTFSFLTSPVARALGLATLCFGCGPVEQEFSAELARDRVEAPAHGTISPQSEKPQPPRAARPNPGDPREIDLSTLSRPRIAGNMTEQDIADQYIVQLLDRSDPEQLAASMGVTPRYVYRDALRGFAARLSPEQLAQLRANPSVKGIEKDQLVSASFMQKLEDGQPWGLDRIDQRPGGLNKSYLYYETGPSVRAYVIDTGIEWYHAELSGRAISVFDTFGSDGDDYNGHGTHVAGTIGGTNYGVAKQVMLRGVRVLDSRGSGSIAGVIAGVNWVTANAIKPAVANMSLGGGYSPALNDAVTALSNSGVFIGVAAGNESADACGGSPSSAFGAMVVGATTSSDTFASFSNFGPCVDILAPGQSILSSSISGRTAVLSGTSMATPHVVGTAALFKQRLGDMPAFDLISRMKSAGTPDVISGVPGYTVNLLLFQPY